MADDVRRPLVGDFETQRYTEDGSSVEYIASTYIAPNTRLSSFERLEIYNRQYWFRLIAAVSEDFPSLKAVLGRERFEALILQYLTEHPSNSWTLRNLGAMLPRFLEAHPELAARRHRLTVDVARLEWAYIDAFDGKQFEPLTAGDLLGMGPDSQLSIQPHLQLLELSYPVDDLVLAVRKQTPQSEVVSNAVSELRPQSKTILPPMKRTRRYLAVHRFEDSVYYRQIVRETFFLLAALRDGSSIAEALEQAFKTTRLASDDRMALVERCFALSSELGWLCRNEVEGDLSHEPP